MSKAGGGGPGNVNSQKSNGASTASLSSAREGPVFYKDAAATANINQHLSGSNPCAWLMLGINSKQDRSSRPLLPCTWYTHILDFSFKLGYKMALDNIWGKPLAEGKQ